jgi:DNA gyrase inhibitor GyrI
MQDEITNKHLQRLRVRGAPQAIPGSVGMVNRYDAREVRKQTMRALAVSLSEGFGNAEIRQAKQKLALAAASQGAQPVEEALIVLNGDPVEDAPSEWTWQLVLPIRGEAKADEEAGLSLERVHGGSYIETITHGGLPDLPDLYTYFLGDFLPSCKQQLTRPVIYHRVVDGLDGDNPKKLVLEIFIPIQLSLKPPLKLSTREEI